MGREKGSRRSCSFWNEVSNLSAAKFINNNSRASLKDLKVGDRVVVHAKRNTDKKLVGAEVKSGTPVPR
jgi:hypothetical protein